MIPTELWIEAWPQLASKLADPLADYRSSILRRTKYVDLSGIPPLDRSGGEIEPEIPLDKVYIRIQAIEQKQQHALEKEEEDHLERENQRRAQEEASVFRRGFFTTVRTLGEYLYRRGGIYQASERPEPVDPHEALKEHNRLVILGAPGAGKSTMLRYLARCAAEDDNGPVPILVSLGKYAAELGQPARTSVLSLREFALKQAAGDDDVLYQLLTDAVEKQEVLWLLDALDEAQPYKQPEKVAEEVARLLGLGQLILTSRPVGYIAADSLKDLPHFEILPLTQEDVIGFLYDWFSILAENRDDLSGNWVEAQVNQLRTQFDERPSLQPLIGNPLLLTFLVILAEEDPTQELPAHRADLYSHFISKLLDRWEKTRPTVFAFEALEGDTQKARRAVLAGFHYLGWRLHLAYFGGQQSSSPNRDTLTKHLEDYWSSRYPNAKNLANEVIDFWMTAGLFEVWHLKNTQTRKKEYFLAFRHLTFQEYAAAEYLLKEWEQTPDQAWQLVHLQFHHYAWREPVLLMAGRMDTALLNDLLRRLCLVSRPFSHLTNRLSWPGWIGIILLGLIIWPIGLTLLVVFALTLPIWLPVVVVIQVSNKKRSTDLSFKRQFVSRYFALPGWLARNILKSWRDWNSDSSQSRVQAKQDVMLLYDDEVGNTDSLQSRVEAVLSLCRAVGRNVGDFLLAWLYLWLLTPKHLVLHTRSEFYTYRLKRSKNSRSLAVTAALQREVLQAAMIIVDNSARVEPAAAQTVAKRLAELMRSDIPALAIAAAELAANVREGLAADIMRSALVENAAYDYRQSDLARFIGMPAAAHALLRQAKEKKLSPHTAKALVKSIQTMDGEVGWKFDVLSYYDDPPPELLAELLQVFIKFIEHYSTAWHAGDTELRIAQKLMGWGAATPVAISILKSEIWRSGRVREGTLATIEQGFLQGQIPAEATQETIEGLVRLNMPFMDKQDTKKAVQAALSSAQPLSKVSRIAALTMIGIPETEGVIDYYVAISMLADVLASGVASPVVFEVLEQGLSDENYRVRKRVVLTLGKILGNEIVQVAAPEVLDLLLKAVELDDSEAKLTAVEIISEAIRANKIKGELIKELGPFWKASRAELENPEEYPWHLLSRGKLTGLTVEALIHLIDAGELPMQSLPPTGFDDASEKIKESYRSFLRSVWPYKIMLGQAKGLQELFVQSLDEMSNPVVRNNVVFMLSEAIRSGGGISASAAVFQRLVNDKDPWVRSPAMRGLGLAIAEGSADASLLPLVICGLKDDDIDVQKSAAEALTSVAKAGKATSAVAEALDQAVRIADSDVRDYLLTAVRYALAAGLGWSEWLDTLVTLYDKAEVEYVQAKAKEIEITQKGVPSLWDIERFREYLEHDKATKAANVASHEMAQVAYALAGAASSELVSSASVKVLLREMENDNARNKEPLITGLGCALKAGWADPNIVKALQDALGKYSHGAGEVIGKTIWALGQAYREPSLREMVLPALVSSVESGWWPTVQAVADLVCEIPISSPELMSAAFHALKNEPTIGNAVRLIGRLSNHQPIPINDLKKVINDMLWHVPPLEWEGHLQGLGYILQNEQCPQEVLELVIATILGTISRYSFEEVKKPAAQALIAAGIVRQEQFETLFAAISSPSSDEDKDWQGAAQIIGEIINQAGEAVERLLSGLYYILQSDEEFFYHNLKERVAQILGYVDSYENTQVLLETLRNKNLGRSFFKARTGSVLGLAQIGHRHPDRQAEVVYVFSEVFHQAGQPGESEDDLVSRSISDQRILYELRCAVIQAIGTMQNTSFQARKILLDAIEFPSAAPFFHDTSLAVYAAEVLGRLDLEPAFSQETVISLLRAMSSSDPRVRDAAWKSLGEVEQKTQGNAPQGSL